MNKQDEIRHINTAPVPTEKPEGIGIARFIVQCPSNAELVLGRVIEILEAVVLQTPISESSYSLCQLSLPKWFMDACSPKKSKEEKEEWLKWWQNLPLLEQQRVSKLEWSFENWLYWFEPDMRQWFWWDAIIEDRNTILVAVEVEAYPFAWGALEWLLRASGATDILLEE